MLRLNRVAPVIEDGTIITSPNYGWVPRILPSPRSSSPGSGVLIANNYIVTTKHTYSVAGGYAAFGGITPDVSFNQDITIDKVITNSQYDIDLIKLSVPIDYSYDLRTIATSINSNDELTLIAWGKWGQLKSGIFNIVECSDLAEDLGCMVEDVPGVKCLKSSSGTVTERGDSGGVVLNSEGEIAGIITERLCNMAGSFLDFTHNGIGDWIINNAV